MTVAIDEYTKAIKSGRLDRQMAQWYGLDGVEVQKKRYLGLLSDLEARLGDVPAVMVSAPARTELGGNHTDHNCGRVLTAAVHLDLVAAASPSGGTAVNVRSDSFPGLLRVDLSDLNPRQEEKGRPESLIRGMASGLREAGLRVGGFEACIQGTAPIGAGLSTSAAFEILMGTIFSHLFNDGAVDEVLTAEVGRLAETRFFGKPCGLMDQIASSLGGLLHIDFNQPRRPEIERIDADLNGFGYRLVVVNTGGSHADLTSDYAAIPREMRAVAAEFGREAMRGLSVGNLLDEVGGLRGKTGDRAILRALHFIEENDRVKDQAAALRDGRFGDYLRLVSASGDSSWRLLQNCMGSANAFDQRIPLALAITERFLEGQGACRVHGGGFAGTIQAYVPDNRLADYIRFMERVFGMESVLPLRIRPAGGSLLAAGEMVRVPGALQ